MRLFVPLTLMIAVLGFLAKFNYYVFFENATNHTSAPVDLYGYSFAVVAVAAGLIAFRRRNARRVWLALAIVTGLASVNILTLNWLHVMMAYDVWVHGMPDRPDWSLQLPSR